MIHPDLRSVARVLPRGLGLRSLRVAGTIERQLERLQPRIDDLQRRRNPDSVPEVVANGTWSVRVHRSPAALGDDPRPGLLWIHGGGYVIGSAAQEDAFCRRAALELGAVVAAVDYRKAPEHPHPASLHDCHDALVWLTEQDGIDQTRVAIGGASAGGGLAATLALGARERGEVIPAFQLLTYPMLDDRTVLRTDIDEHDLRIWNNRANRYGWASYLATEPGANDVAELAAPARCADLTGLAPAWIGVGTCDLFHDEDLAYAARLRAAGVPCQIDVVEGAFHGFDYVAPKARVTESFRAAQLGALAAALTRTPTPKPATPRPSLASEPRRLP